MDSEQDQFLEDGTFVLRWQLRWVSGWDPEHGEYRAVMADNYGHADVYRGSCGCSLDCALPRPRTAWRWGGGPGWSRRRFVSGTGDGLDQVMRGGALVARAHGGDP